MKDLKLDEAIEVLTDFLPFFHNHTEVWGKFKYEALQTSISTLQKVSDGKLVEPMSRENIIRRLFAIDKFIGVSSFPKENYEIIADNLVGKLSTPCLSRERLIKTLERLCSTRHTLSMCPEIVDEILSPRLSDWEKALQRIADYKQDVFMPEEFRDLQDIAQQALKKAVSHD
jgi:hypothetical protein